MKLVVQVKLLPSPEEAEALEATLRACNRAAERASAVAYKTGVTSRNDLQKLVYAGLKADYQLGAQPAVRTVKKVVDAYATLRANLRAGNLGPVGSKRRTKAESKAIAFRPDAAQPFDDRILSWQHDARTVSIWTVVGRVKGLRYTGHPGQLAILAKHRRGESDLVRHARKRAELQARQTRSATRHAKRRAKREARHAAHTNHKISKEIVAIAQRTGRGIAIEELDGIRDRVRPSRDQRAALSSWPFHQLEERIRYKARRVGVPVIAVDAHYTSQMCPRCGHTERGNRPSRNHFRCRRCGLAGPADVVAGVNVRNRARSAWVLVNGPVPQRA